MVELGKCILLGNGSNNLTYEQSMKAEEMFILFNTYLFGLYRDLIQIINTDNMNKQTF